MPPNLQTPPPKKDRDWGRMSKQLSFWILLILIPLAFIKLTNPASEHTPTITYTQYDRELERGATPSGDRGALLEGHRLLDDDAEPDTA